MNPIIFLDFDGVIVVGTDWRKASPVHIQRLNRIIEATGAEIVVSSSWRYGHDCEALLKEWGCVGKVIGCTPKGGHELPSGIFKGETRGSEIQGWLELHPTETFIIIDDDPDMGALRPRCIFTDFRDGLQDLHVQLAIRALTKSKENSIGTRTIHV